MPTATTRIRLRPANNSRVDFWGQLLISGGWVLYALFAMQRDNTVDAWRFVHWPVLLMGAAYLIFVLIHNAPVFGTQSYLEFTPGYLVHKSGLFRAKQVFAAEKMAALELKPLLLRVRLKDGEIYPLNLRQVKGRSRKVMFREQVRQFAAQHGVALQETSAAA